MIFKQKLLAIFFIAVWGVSSIVFGEEALDSASKPYLPKDKYSIVGGCRNQINHDDPYYSWSYVGNDDKEYLVRLYIQDNYQEGVKAARIFFGNGIYEMFGLNAVPKYLVKASDVSGSYVDNHPKAFVAESVVGLKVFSFDKLDSKEKVSFYEQLSKLHIVSALIDNTGIVYRGDHSDLLMDGDKLIAFYLDHEYRDLVPYIPSVDSFEKLIQIQSDINAANLFQEPFREYALNNISTLIDWFDEAWDESKVDELAVEAGITEEELSNFKLRFKDLKVQLERIKSDGLVVLGQDDISNLLKANKANKANNIDLKLIAKNINYKFRKDILPKVEEQSFICSDERRVWLELTNFEFIVNSKETNKLVTVYIGKVGDQAKATKIPIEIYDPETAFIFQDAIIRYWDNLFAGNDCLSRVVRYLNAWNGSSQEELSNLVRALQVGYQAVRYHFGFSDKLFSAEEGLGEVYSDEGVLNVYYLLHSKYIDEAKNIGRLVDKDTIKKRKSLGLIAYYPNPFYLSGVAEYLRPVRMSYNEYVKQAYGPLRFGGYNIFCDEEPLLKEDVVGYQYCDDYDLILQKIYSKGNSTHLYSSYSNFSRKSAYVFRGDFRNVEEVYKNDGFWSRLYIEGEEGMQPFRDRREEALSDEYFWELDRYIMSSEGAYVSTSKLAGATRNYGKNLYVLFVEGVLDLSEKVSKEFAIEREMTILGGTDWSGVVGFRERENIGFIGERYPIGPVYLRGSLIEADAKNFWEILQRLGDKQECSDEDFVFDVAEECIDSYKRNIFLDASESKGFRDAVRYVYDKLEVDGNEEIFGIFDKMSTSAIRRESKFNRCENFISRAIGLLGAENRRR